MRSEIFSSASRRTRGHERREWNGLREHDRHVDTVEHERRISRGHRAEDARRREADTQIRELRARF